jgi:hypothetical protein
VLFLEPALHAGGGIEAERRAAGERDRVDASTVCAGSSRAVSRVPGPPPRTSIEPTAGTSNTIAVAPEPSRVSSAWPTFRPGTSVMRLRKTHSRYSGARS